MADEFVTVGIHVDEGTKRSVAALILGTCIDERSLAAGERKFVVVILKQILPDLRANALDEIADMPDDWVVAKDRVLGLAKIGKPYQR